jgi:6-phosphogluconolactonase
VLSLDDYLPSTPATPRLVVGRDVPALANVLADRLIRTLAFRLKDEWVTHAHIAITGGLISQAICDALQDSPLRREIDWRQVHVWWTDDAFMPEGHISRNETRVRAAGIARVGIPETNLHPVPASLHSDDAAVDRAATEYASLLRRFSPHGRPVPVFDVLLLDVGPLGDVGALYPGERTLDSQATVVAVANPPSPPMLRVSMTLAAIRNAARVWLLASGADRADAVTSALMGADLHDVPAAGAKGVIETKWWVDEAAARTVPRAIRYGVPAEPSPAA